jgi:hypothetical protein
MYIVVSRKNSGGNSRGSRGVRALKLESDFIHRLDDAQAKVTSLELQGIGAWIAEVKDFGD